MPCLSRAHYIWIARCVTAKICLRSSQRLERALSSHHWHVSGILQWLNHDVLVKTLWPFTPFCGTFTRLISLLNERMQEHASHAYAT